MTPNVGDFLDNLDDLDDPHGVYATLRLLLDHLEAQRHVPTVARAEKDLARGLATDVSADFLHCVLDMRTQLKRPKQKWYTPSATLGDRSGSTRLTLKRGICFHHTAVRGGFGADKAIVQRYLDQAQRDGVRMELFSQYSRTLTPEEFARALALGHRFRGDPPRQYNEGVPYHAIMAANSVLYLNLPFKWVTWHGNGSNNDFLGVAWDALSTKESCVAIADDLISDIEAIITLARAEGHPCNEFTIHAAWTRKPDDPRHEFIAHVMEPAAREFGCVIDYDFKAKGVAGARSIREVLDAA